MLYKILIILLSLSLSSCGDSDLIKAKKQYTCRMHGGHYNRGLNESNITVTCRDGMVLSVEQVIKDPIFYPKQ